MTTPAQNRSRAVATLAVIFGVAGILYFAHLRQEGQTEVLARGWVGEQWDVARQCLVGTPIGRGESEEAIARVLEARLYRTLLEASEADAPPDPATLWPARCSPVFASLRVDPAILRGDPGTALSALEVLAPRVLGAGGEGPAAFAVGEARERTRELAGAIARLDAAMPPGAEYDAAEFPAETIDAEAVHRSLTCAGTTSLGTRPFLVRGPVRDELFGEPGRRIEERESGALVLVTAGAAGTTEAPLARPGFRDPRFLDEAGTIAWLDEAGVALGHGELGLTSTPGARGRVELFASCSVGDAVHLAVLVGEGVHHVAWPVREAPPELPVAVRPTPPTAGTRFFCARDAAAFAWTEEDTWTVVTCRQGACRRAPPLRAGGDLALAHGPAGWLALARGRRTDLPLARTLGPRGWSEPWVARRGALRGDGEQYAIEVCGETVTSLDGRTFH